MNQVSPPYRRKLAILLWSATSECPALCATPFVHAAAAAAFDCEVEMHFAGPAVRLLVSGVGSALRPWPGSDTSVHDMMQQAAHAGVRFLACAMALKSLIDPQEVLIAEYGGSAGASAFVDRVLDPDWSTLVF